MSTLLEVYRHTFPKTLRYDKASQILYAELYSVSRRHKHKKYIPLSEVQKVMDGYERMPGSPWLQLPLIRHLFCIRFINSIRCFTGRQSWLYNRNVEVEYRKVQAWITRATAASSFTSRGGSKKSNKAGGGSAPAASQRHPGSGGGSLGGKPAMVVERDVFDREVLCAFHVATMYHRMMRLGFVVVFLLMLLVAASLNTDWLVYIYLRYWCRMSRAEVLEWYRGITLKHTVAEVPPAYQSILPPPCARYLNEDGEPCYAINMVEMTLPSHPITVIAIPCPQMGEKKFYSQIGEVAQVCDSVLMEGVTFDQINRLAPVAFFPLKDDTFPALGVHHRFLDILRYSSAEPPKLYPAGADVSWRALLQRIFIPFELRCVYNPTALSATKGEARVGWGRLRQVVEAEIAETETPLHGERVVICVPWTLHQIVNIEASLVKYGFKVRNVFPVHWIREDHIGDHFCTAFGLTDEESGAGRAASAVQHAVA